jgi:tRNA U55 pseudouridine synthase TruB
VSVTHLGREQTERALDAAVTRIVRAMERYEKTHECRVRIGERTDADGARWVFVERVEAAAPALPGAETGETR